MKKQEIYRSQVLDESRRPVGDIYHYGFTPISEVKGEVNPYDGSFTIISDSGNSPFAVVDVPDDAGLQFDSQRNEHVLVVPSDGKMLTAEEAYLWYRPDGVRSWRKP